MKPFDIELAKKNYPIQTRKGDPARIICYDRKDKDYPIVALVKNPDTGLEETLNYTLDGKFMLNGSYDNLDLVMTSVKKEGWVNIYKSSTGGIYTEQERVYNSEKEAIEGKFDRSCNRFYIASVKINFEE